jgi:hypothetical protein
MHCSLPEAIPTNWAELTVNVTVVASSLALLGAVPHDPKMERREELAEVRQSIVHLEGGVRRRDIENVRLEIVQTSARK